MNLKHKTKLEIGDLVKHMMFPKTLSYGIVYDETQSSKYKSGYYWYYKIYWPGALSHRLDEKFSTWIRESDLLKLNH